MVRSKEILNKGKILYILTILITSMLITTPIAYAAPGDFVGTLDYYKYDVDAYLPHLIRINDTGIFASFSQDGGSNDGYIETIQANTTGDLNFTTTVDYWEYSPIEGIAPGVCHITGTDQYLVGCSIGLSGGIARFSTARIFEDGTIQRHLIDNATLNVSAYYFNITHFSGAFYVAVSQEYVGGVDRIFIHTVHVNASGTIYINDTQALPTSDGKIPKVQVIDNNRVAISFLDGGTERVNVTTWYINPSNGDISGKMTDGQSHNACGDKGKCDIKRIGSSTVYIVSYSYEVGASNWGPGVAIVEIDTNGIITSADTYSSSHDFNRAFGNNAVYASLFTVQQSTLYGIVTGQYVFLCNVTGTSVALHGLDTGYVTSAAPSTLAGNPMHIIPFEQYAFVFAMEKAGDDDLYTISFQVEHNYAAPELTPSPTNGSSIPTSSTSLSVYASDDNADDMTINWWSNISGSWVLIGTNASVSNGTYTQYPVAFQSLNWNTEYYWRVDALDWQNLHNTSELYSFTPVNFTVGVANTSEYIDLQPNVSVYVSGAVDNVTWYWWNNDTWEQFGNNETSYVAGNYSMHFQNATECCTIYQWAVDASDSGTGASDFTQYWFISMCLAPPTNFNAARVNGTIHNLTWTEWSNSNATGTVQTMIRYSNTSYPTSPTDGILLYNGTHPSVNHTGLTEGQQYYYSAWTIYHHNTSWCTSSSYSTDSLTAQGGTYNITLRNESTNHLLEVGTVFWDNLRVIARMQNGTVLYIDTLDNHASNPFSIDVNQTPDVVLITYESWGVIRSLTPAPTTRNLTFWFSMRDYWNGSTSTLNTSQVYYDFEFIDLTRNSMFLSSPETKFYVYRDYNSTVTMTIHQMFLGTDRHAWASLEYGKEYFIGIERDGDHRERLPGSILADSDYTKVITIFPKNDSVYFIKSYVTFNTTAISNRLWINYTDSSFLTNHSDLKIYKYHSNGTIYLLKNYTFIDVASFNQQWTTVEGYDSEQLYMVEINITHPYFDDIVTIIIYSFPYMEGRYDPGWFNTVVEDLLGESPIPNVSYAGLVSFILGFFFLVTFGQYNGEMGLFSCGFSVFFMEVLLWDNSPTRFIAGTTAVAMIALSILFYYGRSQR
jgi:hypothetical protein